MMSNAKGWILTGLVAILFLKVSRSARALKIALSSYEIDSVNLVDGTVGMYLYFTINNPLWVGVTLKEISGSLMAQSGEQIETIGTVDNKYNYFIRGNATHVVRAKINISSKSALTALMQNIQSGDVNNLLLTFDGKLTFGSGNGVAIPIKRTMTYKELVQ